MSFRNKPCLRKLYLIFLSKFFHLKAFPKGPIQKLDLNKMKAPSSVSFSHHFLADDGDDGRREEGGENAVDGQAQAGISAVNVAHVHRCGGAESVRRRAH